MDRPQKVVAYVVRAGRLLVFTHANDDRFDTAGVQVPAGTVRAGELPQDAVLREATEETRLEGLRIQRYLGTAEYDMRPYTDAIHVRHFFQLSPPDRELPEQWFTYEQDGHPENPGSATSAALHDHPAEPSGTPHDRAWNVRSSEIAPIRFHLYWLPLTRAHVIAAGQAALVGRLSD